MKTGLCRSLVMLVALAGCCQAQKTITVDYGVKEAVIKDLMGVNRGPESRSAGYRDAGITMVRMHDYHGANDYPYYSTFWRFDQESKTFTTLNPYFNPREPDHYRWQDFDAQVGRLVEEGFVPYIRLGVSYPNPRHYTVPYEPPLDPDAPTFERFAGLCKATVMHCNAGWSGGSHHNIRYWEVWNEPDGVFWKGSALQYYQMYRAVYDSLKALDPNLKIGGPGAAPTTTMNIKKQYSDGFLAHLGQNNSKLDFYSWHMYGIKNPYALNYFADYFRDKLDRLGFKSTESHITEINDTLDSTLAAFTDSGRGAAYYVSLLITAQRSAVDKLFWYQGNGFFQEDAEGQPRPTWGGLGLKAYSMLTRQCQWQIASHGDETVSGHWQSDTTNLVSLAACSDDGNVVGVLIANYNIPHHEFHIQLKNLPWQSSDSITVLKSVLREPDERLSTFSSVVNGAATLSVSVPDLPAPSVLLLQLLRHSTTTVAAGMVRPLPHRLLLYANYPNPFNDETVIRFALAQRETIELDLFDTLGKKIATLARGDWPPGEHQVKWRSGGISGGVFFYRLRTDHECRYGKMLLLR